MEPVTFNLRGETGGVVGYNVNPEMVHGQDMSFYTVPLADILDRHNAPAVIDYLSLDIEGAEYDAMKDFPFDRYQFKIMTIERAETDLQRLLVEKGYHPLTMIADYGESLWVHRDLEETLDLQALGNFHFPVPFDNSPP